jgi:UTP--glucose-1-phosphate uridylyltransferase
MSGNRSGRDVEAGPIAGAGRRPIRTAVIPAAGQGTRMLPATKAVPKELLPILERPAIQYIVDEALGAGVDHLVVVTSRSKPAIEHYFARSPEVERSLIDQGRGQLARQLSRFGDDVRISFVYQDAPRGLGHAVACARTAVGDQPFYVMLPDELMEDSSLLVTLGDIVVERGTGAVALKRVPADETSRYGIVTPVGPARDHRGWETIPMARIVEKPAADPPSDLAIIGRYALTPDVFDDLDRIGAGASGEIQLTDALSRQSERSPLHGVVTRIGRRDVGNPLGWIEAVIEAGLGHAEIGPRLRPWLRDAL